MTNVLSVFRISPTIPVGTFYTNVSYDEDEGVWYTQQLLNVEGIVINWQSVTGRLYRVYSSTNLLSAWPTGYLYQVSGDGAVKSYTGNVIDAEYKFFRLGVEKP